MDEWKYEPGFSFEVTHVGGNTHVALEVGLGLKPGGSQLLFMVKTRAPMEWVALSGDEVRFLDGILDFFETHRVFFASSGTTGVMQGVVVCKDTDYDFLVNALGQYASFSDVERDEAEEILEGLAKKMTLQAQILTRIIATFVDEASAISKGPIDDPGLPPEETRGMPDEAELKEQAEQVDLAVSSILEDRRALIEDLDAMA